MLGDCLDHSPTIARGLCVSTTCDWRLAYSWDILSHLDLATRHIPRLPASSGTTSVRCTCRCILYRLYDDWILNLTGTLAPRAYVTYYQARGLSGHTSPCGECARSDGSNASDSTRTTGVSSRLRVKVGTLRGKYFLNFILSPLHPSGKLKTALLEGYKALGD